MRIYITKKHFTKAERIFARVLQENHIHFQAKVTIANREVDFLVGKYAIEIDGHEQDGTKNHLLADLGYIPLHFSNKEIYEQRGSIINKFT